MPAAQPIPYGEELAAECSSKLAGKEVAFCVDGWSNVSQESSIGSSIQYNGRVYIEGTTDASSVVHTSENIAEITKEHIVLFNERMQNRRFYSISDFDG